MSICFDRVMSIVRGPFPEEVTTIGIAQETGDGKIMRVWFEFEDAAACSKAWAGCKLSSCCKKESDLIASVTREISGIVPWSILINRGLKDLNLERDGIIRAVDFKMLADPGPYDMLDSFE